MPMLVCSESDFELEISRLKVDYKTIEHGRGLGKKEVPIEIRKLAASEALAGVSVEEIRTSYNISPSSISAYKNGANSTTSYHKPDADLKKNNDNVRVILSERAEGVALEAIGLLTVEKLADCKARDLSGIAKDMSGVMANIRDNGSNNGTKVQVLIYQPQIKSEEDFNVIEVRE